VSTALYSLTLTVAFSGSGVQYVVKYWRYLCMQISNKLPNKLDSRSLVSFRRHVRVIGVREVMGRESGNSGFYSFRWFLACAAPKWLDRQLGSSLDLLVYVYEWECLGWKLETWFPKMGVSDSKCIKQTHTSNSWKTCFFNAGFCRNWISQKWLWLLHLLISIRKGLGTSL